MIPVNCKHPQLVLKSPDCTDEEYLEETYQNFKTSFTIIKDNFTFNNKIIKFRYNPIRDKKEEVFWHITTTDQNGIRHPDFERYQRINWAQHVLLQCFNSNQDCNLAWIRKKRNRIHIWCVELDYIVVLEERKDYILFITAYPINREHSRNKLKKEYGNCCAEFIIH